MIIKKIFFKLCYMCERASMYVYTIKKYITQAGNIK